jgi:hypothetical protein
MLHFQHHVLVLPDRGASDGDSTAKQYKRTSSTTGRECGSRLPDRQDIKQVCHTQGPSDVLVGDSAALDGPFKLCGSDLKPENQRKVGETRRAVAMKQRRNTGTDEGKF